MSATMPPERRKLVGVAEVAEMMCVTRQRAHEIRQRPDFPPPFENLACGPIWLRPSVDAWIQEQWT